MKNILILIFLGVIISCSTSKKSPYVYKSSSVYKSPSVFKEDEMINRRKYIGNFIDFCHTAPDVIGGTHLIWIKTTIYSSFGKLAAYGKNCEFTPGERIYLKRLYSTPGSGGNWQYQIENDSMVFYMVSDYRYENNALVQASF